MLATIKSSHRHTTWNQIKSSRNTECQYKKSFSKTNVINAWYQGPVCLVGQLVRIRSRCIRHVTYKVILRMTKKTSTCFQMASSTILVAAISWTPWARSSCSHWLVTVTAIQARIFFQWLLMILRTSHQILIWMGGMEDKARRCQRGLKDVNDKVTSWNDEGHEGGLVLPRSKSFMQWICRFSILHQSRPARPRLILRVSVLTTRTPSKTLRCTP